MVDIASASSASTQVQVDRSSSQENTVSVREILAKQADDTTVERKEVEAETGPNLGNKIDIKV
ncbi:hypothetical protein [Paremcibacter congregatus]|uniref:Uncharacterized protein n=1 Tax=Paremcibacter congregatus TaxID=2043170 RepID=A0A2G4YUW4_9PROT|nr:hypothetical protein [Paremcibacter congregatus]PHZ86118.1 hypothetical protein CRD36_05465 [Paremcibacter congregatus]QDE27084.1 hypothetical protein FIV45_07240 [Paremcibacter congregatus]|tara:strand:- start:5680 stop:5868 length:189 start_codon:yes stop_codon:yes gene_type:complete